MSEIIPTDWTDFCVSVQDHEKTKTSSCTFLSVLVHFNVISPKLKDEVNSYMFFSLRSNTIPSWVASRYLQDLALSVSKAVQLRKALDVILQWCFNHNFSVRLYALLALKRVWGLAEARAAEGVDGFGALSAVVKACLNQAEAMQSTGWAQNSYNKCGKVSRML